MFSAIKYQVILVFLDTATHISPHSKHPLSRCILITRRLEWRHSTLLRKHYDLVYDNFIKGFCHAPVTLVPRTLQMLWQSQTVKYFVSCTVQMYKWQSSVFEVLDRPQVIFSAPVGRVLGCYGFRASIWYQCLVSHDYTPWQNRV